MPFTKSQLPLNEPTMPLTTQYTTLLLELEQLDQQLRKEKQQAANETTGQTTRHRPVQSGGHGVCDITEEQLQAA